MLIFSAVDAFLIPVGIPDGLPVSVDRSAIPRVMQSLGFSRAEAYGDHQREHPGVFLGRVMLAQALAPFDPGLPETRADNGALLTHGLARGYLQAVLTVLEELGRYCLEREHLVAWRIAG